ncbi:glycerate kinase [Rhodococcus sp. H29-C3]|uniref:glycerate kinase family protein n=1 Tax=Rhodococcus sp. H29-C3 TaxID=3046307 RepID=UPI0024BA6B3A|nr:glycerate kinase [Rhodococcus sp. H29-C3]MDJ0360942.1 glycerate kinase [Rhodococcus sp. H29-C3]
MRVMIAPDSFGNTLSANEAADAIARGWRLGRPEDELVLAPQSDGGPGFVDVLAGKRGEVRELDVYGPLGKRVRARWLLDGHTAFIEVAQACGLSLLDGPPTTSSASRSSSDGVGQLIDAALGVDGIETVFVGLGGSSCTDGGRGMIRALGGLADAAARLRSVELVAATDVENPLLGEHGAAHVFGAQKGADAAMVDVLEELNREWAVILERVAGVDVAELPGAGAAGGIGAALFALGGRRESGAAVVAELTDQADLLESVDLVITGEGKFDSQSLRGKLVTQLASAGAISGAQTIVLAGQVALETAQWKAAGLSRAYSVAEFAGSVDKAMSDAGPQLEHLAAYAARRFDQGTPPLRGGL